MLSRRRDIPRGCGNACRAMAALDQAPLVLSGADRPVPVERPREPARLILDEAAA